MLRLDGGTHFLVLRRDWDRSSHQVFVVPRFDDTLADWEPGSRISPVFPTVADDASPSLSLPRFEDEHRSWLLFLGPLHPGEVHTETNPTIFITLGLFNIVAYCETETQIAELLALAAAEDVPWEKWELLGHRIAEVSYSPARPELRKLPSTITAPISTVTWPDLKPTTREYSALIASAISRARNFCPSAVRDLEQFDRVFRELLNRAKTAVARHGNLVLTNAALSRYASQTFAGTSPIQETECHFWTHSLLGVGVASMALQRLRTSIDRVVEEARLIDRLKHLANVSPGSKELTSLPTSDSFWGEDFLCAATPPFIPPPDHGIDDQSLPVITCFSGRDGFRSTELSLSAPLEVITGCGTTSWTLQTITHEMSHVIILAVLAALLPSPGEPEEVSKVFKLLDNPDSATSLLDRVRSFLAFSIWKTNRRPAPQEILTQAEFGVMLRRNWQEVNEILTHVFDFLYFYRQNSNRYIESIWASWGVIPNIERRIEQYVIRSLCALHVNNLRRAGGVELSIEELCECLKQAHERFPSALYISEAIEDLSRRKAHYIEQLNATTRLIQFARTFLYSPQIATLIMSENVAVGGKETYTFPPLTFSDERIGNPLRFIDENTDHKKIEHQRALWMLVQLAFAELR